MAKRKKLAAAEPKMNRRLKLKIKDQPELFEKIDTTLYYSGFALTDNKNLVLFFIDQNLFTGFNFKQPVEDFDLTENDLEIVFDKNVLMEPNENFYFDNMGYVRSDIFNWFKSQYPKCVFHPVTKWFGKQVNTLLIILEQRHGKPVGVAKTFNT